MNKNAEILASLINEDFGLQAKDGSRWGKSDDHDSLVLDNDRGIFFWNSRGIVGDPLVYLTRIRGMGFENAKEFLRGYKSYSSTFVYTINSGGEDVVVYPELVKVFSEDGRNPERRRYWYDRGISDSSIDRFQLGWYNDYVTVPIFIDGTFRNFQLRRDNPKKIRSYYRGVGALVYNSDLLNLVDTVYITEGLTDCIKLNQERIPSVSHNAGAGGWQDGWFKYFIRQKEIYVIFDNDRAGKNGVRKVCKNLGIYRTKVFSFDGYDDKYDCVEFFRDGGTRDDLLDMVHTKSKYLFEL